MHEAIARAGTLLRKAEEDLHAAMCLAREAETMAWTVGFHAQQAVEKALKAALQRKGVRYPFTHDLAALLRIAHDAGLPTPPDSDTLPHLTPFATSHRYEDEDEDQAPPLDVQETLASVQASIRWAKSVVESKE